MRWKGVDIGEKILDFGMAIEEHDLLAYVTHEFSVATPSRRRLCLVLRHHSDPLRSHKDASISRIPICLFTIGHPTANVEVAGENVAIATTILDEGATFINRIYVFNWKTGLNKTPVPLQGSSEKPVFLREDILLSPMEDFSFFVYFIPPSSSPSSFSRLVLSLGLPKLADNQIIESMEPQCSPSPTRSSMFPKNLSQERPFFNDPMAATVVFSFTIELAHSEEEEQWAMVVHRKSILDLLPSHELVGGRSTPFTHVPWESWGPPVRFCVDGVAAQFRMNSSGQRYVQHLEMDQRLRVSPYRSITFFDFNP